MPPDAPAGRGEDPAGGGGPQTRRRRRRRAVLLAVLLLLVAVEVWIFTRGGSPEEEAPPDRPDLRAEAVMGCYVLRAGPWRRDPAAALDSLPPALEPPVRVALLPDSADAHGRGLPSFRAEAISEAERPDRDLRWTVRADTLWLLWAEPGARGGAALFAEGDSLLGSARAVAEGVDAAAPAVAWPINCSTLGRERGRGRPRR